jgi:hypothetical protein
MHGEVDSEKTEKTVGTADIRTAAYKRQMYYGTDFHQTEAVKSNTRRQVEKSNRRVYGRFQDQSVGGWNEN